MTYFIIGFASLSSISVLCSLWWDSCHWNSSFRIGPLVSMAMSGSCLHRWAFTKVVLVICACLHYAPMSKVLLEAVHHTQLLCVTGSAWPLLRQCLMRLSWARHGHTHGERVVRFYDAPVVTFQMARACISNISYSNRLANEERSRALSDQCDDKIPPFSEASSVHGVWLFKVLTIRTLYVHRYHVSFFLHEVPHHSRFQRTYLASVICAYPCLIFTVFNFPQCSTPLDDNLYHLSGLTWRWGFPTSY